MAIQNSEKQERDLENRRNNVKIQKAIMSENAYGLSRKTKVIIATVGLATVLAASLAGYAIFNNNNEKVGEVKTKPIQEWFIGLKEKQEQKKEAKAAKIEQEKAEALLLEKEAAKKTIEEAPKETVKPAVEPVVEEKEVIVEPVAEIKVPGYVYPALREPFTRLGIDPENLDIKAIKEEWKQKNPNINIPNGYIELYRLVNGDETLTKEQRLLAKTCSIKLVANMNHELTSEGIKEKQLDFSALYKNGVMPGNLKDGIDVYNESNKAISDVKFFHFNFREKYDDYLNEQNIIDKIADTHAMSEDEAENFLNNTVRKNAYNFYNKAKDTMNTVELEYEINLYFDHSIIESTHCPETFDIETWVDVLGEDARESLELSHKITIPATDLDGIVDGFSKEVSVSGEYIEHEERDLLANKSLTESIKKHIMSLELSRKGKKGTNLYKQLDLSYNISVRDAENLVKVTNEASEVYLVEAVKATKLADELADNSDFINLDTSVTALPEYLERYMTAYAAQNILRVFSPNGWSNKGGHYSVAEVNDKEGNWTGEVEVIYDADNINHTEERDINSLTITAESADVIYDTRTEDIEFLLSPEGMEKCSGLILYTTALNKGRLLDQYSKAVEALTVKNTASIDNNLNINAKPDTFELIPTNFLIDTHYSNAEVVGILQAKMKEASNLKDVKMNLLPNQELPMGIDSLTTPEQERYLKEISKPNNNDKYNPFTSEGRQHTMKMDSIKGSRV